MRLTLTPDQEFFRATTAKFLTRHASPDEVRRLRDNPAGFDPEYWRRGAELGWTSLLVGEDRGGGSISGEGLVDLTLVAHEFGRHAAPGPLLPTNVVAAALGRHGTDDHAALIAGLLTGDVVASVAFAEPGAEPFDAIALDARRDGSDLVLNGTKRPVESGAEATHLLVTVRTDDGLTQVIVPTDTVGVSVHPLRTLDLTRRFAMLRFEEVRVPLGAVVGQLGQASADVERQLQEAVVILVAESVGAMEHAFELTLEWACDRYSFGRPLASYQELKHRFADMKTWLEAGHAITDAAAAAVQSGSAEAARLASAAKAFVGAYGAELIQDCVQIHGGIGLTFDHDVHLYLRRHVVNTALWGSPDDHHRRVAAMVGAR